MSKVLELRPILTARNTQVHTCKRYDNYNQAGINSNERAPNRSWTRTTKEREIAVKPVPSLTPKAEG